MVVKINNGLLFNIKIFKFHLWLNNKDKFLIYNINGIIKYLKKLFKGMLKWIKRGKVGKKCFRILIDIFKYYYHFYNTF
jgi:hypothetical protein